MTNDFMPPADPWDLFALWFEDAKCQEPCYPDAMTLATVSADSMPSARVVLMKEWDARGVVFYTNGQSRKGVELAAHAKASLCFYWKSLQRQIRIEGAVIPVDAAEADAYFATRPRGSQVGAWASQQSRPLADRMTLERRVAEVEALYQGRDIPRPPYWGGYRLTPRCFEFWQEQPYRLHDRIIYTRRDRAWDIGRIYP